MKDSARDVPAWGVGGTNSAKLRFERQSAFSLAKVVSRRASLGRLDTASGVVRLHAGSQGRTSDSTLERVHGHTAGGWIRGVRSGL